MKRVVLAVLLLASCQSDVVHVTHVFPTNPILWSFPCDFPIQHKFIIRKGFDYWEKILGKQLFIEEKNCGVSDFFIPGKKKGITVVIVNKQEYTIKNKEKIPLWATATTATYSNKVLSSMISLYTIWQNSEDDGVRESVVRHEVGHALGFGHSSLQRCLMYKIIEASESRKGACLSEIKKFHELYQ
jgi:hypothetical protein